MPHHAKCPSHVESDTFIINHAVLHNDVELLIIANFKYVISFYQFCSHVTVLEQ